MELIGNVVTFCVSLWGMRDLPCSKVHCEMKCGIVRFLPSSFMLGRDRKAAGLMQGASSEDDDDDDEVLRARVV